MGINGLLLNLRSISERRHLSHFTGLRAGIDGYAWLHRGVHRASLCDATGPEAIAIVSRYFETKLRYFISLEIKALIVFDGDRLPLKSATEARRAAARRAARDAASRAAAEGRPAEARRLASASIDVTPQLAAEVKKVLVSRFGDSVKFLVAPYEADSQLAFLCRFGWVDFVVTEDSDLLPFGAKRVFYKMDRDFWGEEVKLENLSRVEELDFDGWSIEEFVRFCVLAGCDYSDSPRGVGVKRAHAIASARLGSDALLAELSGRIEDNYAELFHAACLVFKFARVFCPKSGKLVHLAGFDPEDPTRTSAEDKKALRIAKKAFGGLDFLGPEIDPKIARAVASCELDPISKERFDLNGHEGLDGLDREGANGYGKGFEKKAVTLDKFFEKRSKGESRGKEDREIKHGVRKEEHKRLELKTEFREDNRGGDNRLARIREIMGEIRESRVEPKVEIRGRDNREELRLNIGEGGLRLTKVEQQVEANRESVERDRQIEAILSRFQTENRLRRPEPGRLLRLFNARLGT